MQPRSLKLLVDELNQINAQIKKENKEMVNLLELTVELDDDASNYSLIATEFLEAGATSQADKYEKLAVEIKKKANLIRKKLETKQAQVEELTALRNDRLLTLGHLRGSFAQ